MTTQTVASLVDYLEASAGQFADRPAIVDPAGWSITYRELDDHAERIAGFLVSAGVGPGDRVGVIMPKGIAALTAFFGIMKARAAYVPADFTAPAARNRAILSDCAVRVAFLTTACAAILESWTDAPPSSVVFLDDGPLPATTGESRICRWAEAISHAPARVEGRDRQDLAYILYTSGSTGVPKGVMLSHENALSFVDWCSEVFAPTEADRLSSHAPFHFDLSVLDIYVAMKHGATLYVVGEELGKSPKELAEFIATSRLTVWYSTPSILALLSQFGDLPSKDCSALRLVLFAGEVFPVKHLRKLVTLWPQADYYNLYGPTETNVCTFARIPAPIPEDRTTPYPIGHPCSHCDALVLDGEGGEITGQAEGLLYIAGTSVFPGYWNRPELNAKAFFEHGGRRWYNTGDVVTRDRSDGFIYLGRRDRMVKRRGYRIELGEIERGLYQHPAIAEAAVIAVADETAGVRLLAYLSARDAQQPSIVEMKVFCGRHLPSYMSPDALVFMEALPRTSTNKVDYQRLAQLARQSASGVARPASLEAANA
jgi:amino acid adenylation domain-containing protein